MIFFGIITFQAIKYLVYLLGVLCFTRQDERALCFIKLIGCLIV
jgi:hypothetical protein